MTKQKSEDKVGLGDVLVGGLVQTAMTSTLATIGIAGLKAAHVIPEHITYKDTLQIGVGLGVLHGAVATAFSLPDIGKTERQIDKELIEAFDIDSANVNNCLKASKALYDLGDKMAENAQQPIKEMPQAQITTDDMKYMYPLQLSASLQHSK